MSFTITQAMVEQYRSNVRMLAEQQASLLQPICEVVSVVGKTFYGERLGSSEAVTRTSRHGDSPYTPVTHSRRKGTIIDKEWGDYIDEQDTQKVIVDFQGKYVTKCVNAFNRAKDDLIIAALGGPAYEGDAGGTTVNNYDSGECRLINGDGTLVTAGSDAANTTETALTIAKLALCGQLLDEAQFPPEMPRFFITNAYNKWQLLQTTEVKSADYNTVKALANGQVDTFMGFKFIFTERLLTHATDTGCIECYACMGGAIALGVGQDIRTDIWPRPDKSGAQYCYGSMNVGATRQEGPAVVEILLKKAA